MRIGNPNAKEIEKARKALVRSNPIAAVIWDALWSRDNAIMDTDAKLVQLHPSLQRVWANGSGDLS